MKKLLLSLLLMVFSAPAFAGQHHHHRNHVHQHWNHHHHHAGRWIAPVIVGGLVGYALAQPTIVNSAPIVVQQPLPATETYLTCTEWKEVMQPNGTIVRERYCR